MSSMSEHLHSQYSFAMKFIIPVSTIALLVGSASGSIWKSAMRLVSGRSSTDGYTPVAHPVGELIQYFVDNPFIFFTCLEVPEKKRRERAEFDSVNTKIWKSHIGRFVNAGVGVNNVFLGGEAEFERRMEAPAHGTTQQVFDVGKRCAVNAYNALMGLPPINHEVKDRELNDLVKKVGLNILDRDSSPFAPSRANKIYLRILVGKEMADKLMDAKLSLVADEAAALGRLSVSGTSADAAYSDLGGDMEYAVMNPLAR